MIRNQMLDPESSPTKEQSFHYGTDPQDDPWFTGGGEGNSPQHVGAGVQGGQFGFGGGAGAEDQGNSMSFGAMGGGLVGDEDYENEPPLLEELGIHFDHIKSKTMAVMHPRKELSEHILDDADLAGPICFCLLLGACLLLSGKVSFGYIYGVSLFGCLGLQMIINLMHPVGLDLSRVCSVLGYCMLPVIALAGLNIFFNLQGVVGTVLSLASVVWATYAATHLLDAKLQLTSSSLYYLVAYPISLLYFTFVLITVF